MANPIDAQVARIIWRAIKRKQSRSDTEREVTQFEDDTGIINEQYRKRYAADIGRKYFEAGADYNGEFPELRFKSEEARRAVVNSIAVREWQVVELAAGRYAGVRDYFFAHDVCFFCKGRRQRTIRWPNLSDVIEPCSCGDGRWKAGDPKGTAQPITKQEAYRRYALGLCPVCGEGDVSEEGLGEYRGRCRTCGTVFKMDAPL